MRVFKKVLILLCIVVSGWAGPAIPPEMTDFFPVGRTFKGVKIPSYTDHVLKSVLEAETITRIDEAYLDITNLTIKSFNPAGEVDSTVKMDKAQYDLKSRQLTSKTEATVKHEKFVMTGDQMGYDTERDVSTMKGRVKVVVPNARKFTGNFGMDAIKGN
jgi:Lipopolysaccharide-assembly, LptC-related